MSDKPRKLTLSQLQKMLINKSITEEQFRSQLETMYVPSQIKIIIEDTKRVVEEIGKRPEKPAEQKIRYVSTFTNGNLVYESVIDGIMPKFLCYNPHKEEWRLEAEVNVGTETYLPLAMGMFPYQPYFLHAGTFDALKRFAYRSKIEELYDSIYNEFDTFIDAQIQHKTLGTVFTLETYQQHKFDALSYLFLLGDIESGKSRYLELLHELCYRAMLTADLNEANVYNFIGDREEGNCTILEDEAHLLSREKNIDKLKIYRAGYRKGSVVPRILDASSTARTQVFYKVYTSKAFAGYYLPYDEAFKTRCIPTHMVWGEPEKDKFDEDDRKRLRKLRFRLLAYRMVHYFDPLPKVEMNMTGRLRETWESKIQTAVGTKGEEIMMKIAENYRNRKMEERRHSLEAYITRTLLVLTEQYKSQIPFTNIYNSLLKILREAQHSSASSYESEFLGRKVSKTIVGLKLGSVFNGNKEQVYGIGRVWTFDRDILNKLKKKYDIDDETLREIKLLLALVKEEEEKDEKITADDLFR